MTVRVGWTLHHRLDCSHAITKPRSWFVALTRTLHLEVGADRRLEEREHTGVTHLDLPGAPCAPLVLERDAEQWRVAIGTLETPTAGIVRDGEPFLWNGHVLSLSHGPVRGDQPSGWEEPTDAGCEGPRMATLNDRFAEQLSTLQRVARALVPIVILGETGTGKEVVARAIHRLSARRGPLVAVNCGALPETLIHSQLFGHRKGAFSGAHDAQPGFVRQADGGTLFLDEIGELPLSAQAVFLRVLQESEVVPVGAALPVRTDLRVVAATNRDLEALVREGRFRADLYARLLGYCIEMPPLRERPEDIGLLIGAILRKIAPSPSKVRLTPAAALALLSYPWPLNVRELERCLATAIVLAGSGPIEFGHLPRAVRHHHDLAPAAGPSTPTAATAVRPRLPPRPLSEEDVRRRAQLLDLLARFEGNIAAVSSATGKARMQIHRWIRRYQIDHQAFRSQR